MTTTDLTAQIRADLDYRRSKLVDPDDFMAEVNFDGIRNALLAVLDLHAPGYPGEVEYEEREEPVYSASGERRGYATVRGEPTTPYWCNVCQEMSPCGELKAVAKALGFDEEA